MNLSIVPGAAAALEAALTELMASSPAGFAQLEETAKRMALASCAEALSRALEARDRELLASSRPAGSRVHSRRPRTLATTMGDVTFSRSLLLDAAGNTLCPLDEELGLPLGDRVSPAARGFLVTCGADVPFARTARLLEMAGGSAVSATTVMSSLRRAGEAVAEEERSAARDLYRDGVPPEADSAAEEVLVEADGTYVRMRGGSTAEVKAVVAYAGKERGGGRARRVEPVRLGCVGEAPGDFWEQAVAQMGRRFDLAGVRRVHLGTDGEAQYVNGISRLRFPDAAGHIDPFHVARAVASCAVDRAAGGAALADAVRSLGPEACADLIDDMLGDGTAREGSEAVAAYLRRHAAEIGGGPSMGTMEAEQQHMYKARMASFPCAWSAAGADAMARVRSWLYSGFALPGRTREGSRSRRRAARRDERLASFVASRPGTRLKSEGKGWEYPVSASLAGMGADVRFRSS